MNMHTRHRSCSPGSLFRRGFTLIEAVTIVVIIALTVPPTVMFLESATARRADAVQAQRATTMGQAVMDFVLADVSSNQPELGFGALADMTAYETSLRSRLRPVSDHYDTMGFVYDINASALVSSSGSATGNPASDVFRIITVTVTAPSAQGAGINVDFSMLVSDL
jgi:type II secretory pathway pseudopilin PulG